MSKLWLDILEFAALFVVIHLAVVGAVALVAHLTGLGVAVLGSARFLAGLLFLYLAVLIAGRLALGAYFFIGLPYFVLSYLLAAGLCWLVQYVLKTG